MKLVWISSSGPRRRLRIALCCLIAILIGAVAILAVATIQSSRREARSARHLRVTTWWQTLEDASWPSSTPLKGLPLPSNVKQTDVTLLKRPESLIENENAATVSGESSTMWAVGFLCAQPFDEVAGGIEDYLRQHSFRLDYDSVWESWSREELPFRSRVYIDPTNRLLLQLNVDRTGHRYSLVLWEISKPIYDRYAGSKKLS